MQAIKFKRSICKNNYLKWTASFPSHRVLLLNLSCSSRPPILCFVVSPKRYGEVTGIRASSRCPWARWVIYRASFSFYNTTDILWSLRLLAVHFQHHSKLFSLSSPLFSIPLQWRWMYAIQTKKKLFEWTRTTNYASKNLFHHSQEAAAARRCTKRPACVLPSS